MPLYEFRCRNCGHKFESLLTSADAQRPACPKCAGEVDKLLSLFGTKSGGEFHASSGGGGCSGCASHNCGSCH